MYRRSRLLVFYNYLNSLKAKKIIFYSTYDYCNYSLKNTNDLFTHFGPGKCPIKSGKHSFDNSEAALPNFGPVFEKVMEVAI